MQQWARRYLNLAERYSTILRNILQVSTLTTYGFVYQLNGLIHNHCCRSRASFMTAFPGNARERCLARDVGKLYRYFFG